MSFIGGRNDNEVKEGLLTGELTLKCLNETRNETVFCCHCALPMKFECCHCEEGQSPDEAICVVKRKIVTIASQSLAAFGSCTIVIDFVIFLFQMKLL
jgi:hypothetical protein